MIKGRFYFAGLFFLALSPLAHAGAFEEGRSFSSDMGRQEISSDAAAELPDAEGDTSQQRGYFQGGQGSTTGPGTTRVLECDAQGNDDPECNAINFMNQNPTPDYPVSRDDPLLEDAKEIRNNAESIAGPDMDSEAECVTTTISGPDMTVEQSCDVFRHGNVSHCDVERVIEVDREVVYQCDDGYSMDIHACSRELNVEVQRSAKCTHGSTVFTIDGGQFMETRYTCMSCGGSPNGYCMHPELWVFDTSRMYRLVADPSPLYYGAATNEFKVRMRSRDNNYEVEITGNQVCSGDVCTMQVTNVRRTRGGDDANWDYARGHRRQYGVNFDGDPEIASEGWTDNCGELDALSP